MIETIGPELVEACKTAVKEFVGVDFAVLFETYKAAHPDILDLSEAHLVREILDSGGYQAEDESGFEDAVMIGATIIAESLEMFVYEYKIDLQTREYSDIAWQPDVIDSAIIAHLQEIGFLSADYGYSAVSFQHLRSLRDDGRVFGSSDTMFVCVYDAAEGVIQQPNDTTTISTHISHHAKEHLRVWANPGDPARLLMVIYDMSSLENIEEEAAISRGVQGAFRFKDGVNSKDAVKLIVHVVLPEIELSDDDWVADDLPTPQDEHDDDWMFLD